MTPFGRVQEMETKIIPSIYLALSNVQSPSHTISHGHFYNNSKGSQY